MTGAHIVVRGWGDLKSREVVFDESTIVCGVLVAGDHGVVPRAATASSSFQESDNENARERRLQHTTRPCGVSRKDS
jgi:hypothetical protein